MEGVRRALTEYWPQLLVSLRRQIAEGATRPNFSRAAEEAGCDRGTAARCWASPQRGTRSYGPLPAIQDVIASEANGGATFDLEAAREPSAPPSATHAPGPSVEPKPTEPTPAPSVEPEPTGPAPSAGPLTVPVSVAAPALVAVTGPTKPEDPEVAEARLLSVARNAAEGLASHTVALLVAIQPMVAATKKSLAATAAGGIADPKFVLDAQASLAKSLTQTAAAIERLANVQSLLSDRPTRTVRVEHQDAPAQRLSEAEVRRQTELVMDTMIRRARELDAEDARPVGAPSKLPEIQEAEVIS